jgi:hypothetical protein
MSLQYGFLSAKTAPSFTTAHWRNTACNFSPQAAEGAALNGSLSDVLV